MDRYELKGELGDGSFGRVMKAALKESGEVVAIKHIKRRFKSWKACVDLREVSSLRNMHHPNIVPIKELIRERDESLYFVFEYMPGGSLFELTQACIKDRKAGNLESKLTRGVICSYARQILSGLSYIHSLGYVHRDIKPENVLVNGSTCKVADFGLARKVSTRGRNELTYYVSTRWYRAPEVILHCPSYNKPIDLFAVGLILAEMCSLRPLFPGSSEIDQINKMMNILGPPTEATWKEGVAKMKRMNFTLLDPSPNSEKGELAIRKKLPRDASPDVAKIVHLLIGWNPSKRPTADKILEQEYFQSSEDRINLVTGDDGLASNQRGPKQTGYFGSNRTRKHNRQEGEADRHEPSRQKHEHRIRGEIVDVEQREAESRRVGPNASSCKQKPTTTFTDTTRESDNEFNQYLNAVSRSSYKPTGNRIRSMVQGNSQIQGTRLRLDSFHQSIDSYNPSRSLPQFHGDDKMEDMVEEVPNPFQSLDIIPTPSTRRSRIILASNNNNQDKDRASTPFQSLDNMPTPSTRRSRIAHATNIGLRNAKSTRKAAKRRHSKQGHVGRAVEKPRWLLLNQNMNMGKRAMEVSISRPAPIKTFDGREGGCDILSQARDSGQTSHKPPDERKPTSSSSNPFTCLASD